MKPIVIPLRKEKVNKKTLTIGVVVVLFLLAVGSYLWLQKTGRTFEINLADYLKQLTAGLATITERETREEEVTTEELEITLPAPTIKIYEETAETGEGITHLARRALKEYLEEKGEDQNLAPEHKIYIEDYLQKKTGQRWLDLGETITFSEELIKEAIEKSRQLNDSQLKNLKQYSSLVPSL